MRRASSGLLAVLLMGAGIWACDDAQEPEIINTDGGIDGGVPAITQCNNTIDDDDDGLIDLDDPGCESAEDNDETDVIPPQCNDGADNDDDGLIDLQDPACESTEDDDESDDPPPPQCADGIDNDDDGAIDLEDRGCANSSDPDESDEPPLPQCQNGEDDDQDGFTDFPSDPGCGSEFDDDEGDDGEIILPQCGNGIDDDNDGRVDVADPGCTSPADPREVDPDEPAACSDGVDNDGDGIVDFPAEPGCAAAGDDDETDGERPPACGNGLDDDEDGKTDYPEDPGCAGVGDRDETDPAITPACSDGVDNDRDELIDYPEDRGCESAADGTESGSCGRTYEPAELAANRTVRGDSRRGEYESEGSCGGRGSPEVVFLYRVERRLEALRIATLADGTDVETAIYVRRGCLDPRTEVACNREPLMDGVAANELRLENPTPGDYYIFLDGASGVGGNFTLQVEEIELAQCLNGVDDDEDGRTDYPADPGCARANDRDETDPDPLPACADDEDNDGDGLVDYPLDVGCRAASDDDEVDLCGDGVRFFQYPVGEPFIIDSTDQAEGASNAFQGSCGGANAPEKVFLYENPFNANLTFSLRHEETIDNTLLYVRSTCLGQELDCNDGDQLNMLTQGEVSVDNAPPGDYFIIVDNRFGVGGQFKLSVEVERLPAGCADGRDNDEDGFIDADDVGCADEFDEDEADPQDGEPLPACWNQIDDDDDGITDYPFDPGCAGKGDNDEADQVPLPACGNGMDDDEDGLVDFPADIGCSARGDEDEEDPRVRPRCSNRIDDDNDNLTDYPNDPGCAAAGDLSEDDDDQAPACADGVDNDRDGLVDFPFDPGCIAAGHTTETDPEVPFACSNGVDDDEDGITDFPREPGCIYAADDDETDPAFPPQCANGNDDDNNGRFDFPDDPGCRFAGDTRELTDGPVPARCADGVDNDDDGFVDLTDIGCLNARDNDENDPEVAPFCADGVDNDDDGTTDWPDDPGCAAQGDECEEFGFGLCNGECVGLLDNPINCGACGRVCADGVQCLEGRCGGLREVVLQCGRSTRPVEEFIRGPLVEAEVRLELGCVPDDLTQAIVVPRNGIGEFNQNVDAIREWVEEGGVVLTEFNISDDVYNALFRANIPQGARNGSCSDNVQPIVQFSPNDQFWADNAFQPIQQGQDGCGYSIAGIPGMVPLGGWNAQNPNLGYVDLGSGRLWLVDADWQDGQANVFTDVSRDLMAYMIANGSSGGGLPPCLDNRDNDEDGLIDAEDNGCTGPADEEEGDPPAGDLPECGDGADNDGDGIIDFPLEPGCETAGDDSEADPDNPPACGNGLDDDGDGSPDYPFDPGCVAVGDREERDPLRSPQCGNGRDDDEDGLTDFPADPGCVAAGDYQEADDFDIAPACANGLDDDRDGIIDWPFDVGCSSARDADEADPQVQPQCRNGIDDDGDGLTDFPLDPGCAFNADPREIDPVDRPACSNGADDDGDGQTDYPDDRGCFFAADDDETDPFRIPPRCSNGVDDDADGLVDLSDVGCVNAEDDDEADGMGVPLCANDVDDDEDGLTDWPADPGCQARGDDGEAQACMDVETIDIPRNGSVMGATEELGADNYRNQCGGRDAPDLVYRYVLGQRGPLTISTDNEGTDYPVVLSVRRDCDEPLSELACVGDFQNPVPTIRLPDALPGEYFIVVDGGGPEKWIGSLNPQIPLPADPNNFQARNDINQGGWSDAGNDAFDGYGRITVTHNGQASGQLNVSLQNAGVAGAAGGYNFTFTSELIGNVWRIRILPAVENDERPVTISLTGNLGSDGNTVSAQRQVPFQGRQIPYMHTSDNFAAPRDPPVFHFMIPSDPEQLGVVNYGINRDNVTTTAANVTLPVTIYTALSYNQDFNAVAAAVVRDLEVQAGGGGADAPRFGNFELSVQEGE